MAEAGHIAHCEDCSTTDRPTVLMVRWRGGIGGSCGSDREWFMLKDRVWNLAQCDRPRRFLCVGCLERRLGRTLTAADFKRSAKVNFVGSKSPRLLRRMRDLKPAKRLRATRFTW